MNKKLIALAVAAGLAAPLAANAEVTVYGKAHVSIDSMSYDDPATEDQLVVASNSSRLGFKGSEDLGGGLSAVFKYEGNIFIDTSAAWNGGRNHYLGLKGGFGTVLAGRMDSPVKGLSRKIELFPEHLGDNRNLTDGWDNRIPNVVAYVSPKIGGGFVVKAAYSTDATGSSPDNNDLAATAITGEYSSGGLFVGVGTESHDLLAGGSDSVVRVSASYKMGAHKFVGMYQATSYDAAGTDTDLIGGGYALTMGTNIFKVQYYMASGDAANSDATLLAVGMDHKFSKSTTGYITYASTDNDPAATYRVNGGGHGDSVAAVAGSSPSGISIGMIQNF